MPFPPFVGAPFDPTFFLSCTVSNVICCLVFGQRFSYDDEHFLSLLHIISETIQFGSSASGLVREENGLGETSGRAQIAARSSHILFRRCTTCSPG